MASTPYFTRTLLACALALLSVSSHATEEVQIKNQQGQVVFEARFFAPGDGPFMSDDEAGTESSFAFSSEEKKRIIAGLELWANILKVGADYTPPIVNIGGIDEPDEAFAMSPFVPIAGKSNTYSLFVAGMHGAQPLPDNKAHGYMGIGPSAVNMPRPLPAQISTDPNADLQATVVHEMAHLLGIMSNVVDLGENIDLVKPYFDTTLGAWSAQLHDDNGKPARPGQAILCGLCQHEYSPDAFDLRQDQGYFAGEHVKQVLAGAMPGVPVSMLYKGEIDPNFMSHSELRNSLMSHQRYRNYVTLMEAELAALQDIGIVMDRRNYFGFSLYGNDQDLDNHHPYAARNAQGNAYLLGQYNTATQGLGLHIYGENNRLTQYADLLTVGAGAAGIRVDGSNNQVKIAPGTKVHAQGVNGRGIMFTYGKDHVLTQRGEVLALGDEGIALAFDFGQNTLGSHLEYRGSYIHIVGDEEAESSSSNEAFMQPATLTDAPNDAEILPELAGPLARRVDISGTVAGKKAALYMSDNALVGEINILQGATVQGDIISLYKQVDDLGQQRISQINFGHASNQYGNALAEANPLFSFYYQGHIQGINNLNIHLKGGQTSLNGEHHIHGLHIQAGASLLGNSTYTLHDNSQFFNAGELSPGNSFGTVKIQGNYTQAASGRLHMEVNASEHDQVQVLGLSQLDGTLHVHFLPDWYQDGWTIQSSDLFSSSQTQGDFSALSHSFASPTLSLQQSSASPAHRWTITRSNSAYTQYANSYNGAQVGQVLAANSNAQQALMRDLYQALDFSASDGSQIRIALEQLGTTAYNSLVSSSLARDHRLSELVGTRGLYNTVTSASAWQVFMQAAGHHTRQNQADGWARHRSKEMGFLLGTERRLNQSDWTYGLHLGVSQLDVSNRAPYSGKGKSTAVQFGLHSRYRSAENPGLFFSAHARMGTDKARMQRHIDVNGYQTQHDSSWHGRMYSVGINSAYTWALSEQFALGPLFALDYVREHRPSVKESGAQSSRLHLSSLSTDSLQSKLGIMATGEWLLQNEKRLQTYMAVAWEHEWLTTHTTQTAQLSAIDSALIQRVTLQNKNAMSINTGLSYLPHDRLEIRTGLNTTAFSKGQRDIGAELSVSWKF